MFKIYRFHIVANFIIINQLKYWTVINLLKITVDIEFDNYCYIFKQCVFNSCTVQKYANANFNETCFCGR